MNKIFKITISLLFAVAETNILIASISALSFMTTPLFSCQPSGVCTLVRGQVLNTTGVILDILIFAIFFLMNYLIFKLLKTTLTIIIVTILLGIILIFFNLQDTCTPCSYNNGERGSLGGICTLACHSAPLWKVEFFKLTGIKLEK